ncbi:uncharacterized protein LOC124798756 [Schistocerca piceifrons]|uniref:uncharacterized protein LOC124798756 n=1 Tax=Schistocerca piceifrons TaxID=274613 RepID=UPI001F5EAB10|nr:uncharacterized protein LOC124798756 [Schistocerca piceifrons]
MRGPTLLDLRTRATINSLALRRKENETQEQRSEMEHPPRYEFGYEVRDEQGARQGHEEARDGEHAAGRYFVALPDGSTQTVSYTADDWGFHPLVSYSRSSQTSASSARIALGEEAVAALHGKQVGKKLKLPSSKVAVQPQATVGATVVQPVVPVSPAVTVVTPAPVTQATPVAAVVLPANQQQEQVVAVTAGGSAASAYQQQNAVYQQQGAAYQQAGAGVSSAFQRQGAAITVPVAAQINALAQEGSSGAESVQVAGLQQQQYLVAPAAQQVLVSTADQASQAVVSESITGRRPTYVPGIQRIRTQPTLYQSVASGAGGSQQQAYTGISNAGLDSYSYQDAALQGVSVKSTGASGYQSAATGGTTVLTTTPSPPLIQTTPGPYAQTENSLVTTTGVPILSAQQEQQGSGVDTVSTLIVPSQAPQFAQVVAAQAQEVTGAQSVGYQAVNNYQATAGGVEYNSVNSLPTPQALISPYDNRGGAQISSYVADANAALLYGSRKAVRLPNVGSTLPTAQASVSYNEGSNQVVEYNAVTPASVRTSLRPIVVADFQESQQNIATVTPSPLGVSYSSTPSTPIVVPDFSSSAAGSASSGSYSGYSEQETHVSTQRPIIVESSTTSGLYTASPTASSLDVVTITPRPEVLPVPSALGSSSQKLSKYAVQGRLSSSQSRFGAKLRRPYYSTTPAPPQVTEKVEEESSNVVISQNSIPAEYNYDQNQGFRLQTSLPTISSTPAPVIYSEQSSEEESNVQINVNQVDNGVQVQQDQQQLLLEAVNGLQYDIGKLQEQAVVKTREEEELLRQEKLRAQHQVQLIKQALAETDAKLKEQSLKEAQLRAQIQAEKQAIQSQQSLSYSAGSVAQGQYQPGVNRIPRPELVAETVVQSSYNTQAGGATVENFPPVKYVIQSNAEELQPIDAYQNGKVLQPSLRVTPLQPALVNPIGPGGLYLVYGGRVQPVGRLPVLYSQQSYVDANLLKAQQQQQQQTSLNFLADLQKQVQAQYRQGLVVDAGAGAALPAVKQQLTSGLVEARVRQHEAGSSSIRQLLEGEKESADKHSTDDDRPRITIEQTKYVEVQRPLPLPQPTALPVPYPLPHPLQVPLQQLLPIPPLTHLPYREYQTLFPTRAGAPKAINFGLAELYHGHADFRGERYGVPRQRLRPAPNYYSARGPAPGQKSGRRRPPAYQRGQLRKLCIEYGGFKPPIVPSQQIDDDDALDVCVNIYASGRKERPTAALAGFRVREGKSGTRAATPPALCIASAWTRRSRGQIRLRQQKQKIASTTPPPTLDIALGTGTTRHPNQQRRLWTP